MPTHKLMQPGSALEVLLAFLKLGCLCFGGPVAHLAYFRAELVERRRWCSEADYAELLALAQSLPGPASSQVAFALGLLRAGPWGALAAWTGFTLPSAALMVGFAFGHRLLSGTAGVAFLHGLEIVAAAIVADAVLAMRRSLAPDRTRLTVAAFGAALTLLLPPAFASISAIAAGGLAGLGLSLKTTAPPSTDATVDLPRSLSWISGALFVILASTLELPGRVPVLAVFQAFFRTGALVFGGGHVVLPLLEHAVVDRGWIDPSTFLAGYGAAQALPGPLFSFAAFLGASIQSGAPPLLLAATALGAIFLPGLLLMAGVLPVWRQLRRRPRLRSALGGINASVLGVLFAALLRPVLPAAIHSLADALLALAALFALTRLRWPPLAVVVSVVLLSVAPSWAGGHR
jgi:chromate transporter